MNKKGNEHISRHGWMKPSVGYVKPNVDVAFDADQGSGGSDAVIRDDHGTFAGSNDTIPLLTKQQWPRPRPYAVV
jgi:hypothetical protein